MVDEKLQSYNVFQGYGMEVRETDGYLCVSAQSDRGFANVAANLARGRVRRINTEVDGSVPERAEVRFRLGRGDELQLSNKRIRVTMAVDPEADRWVVTDVVRAPKVVEPSEIFGTPRRKFPGRLFQVSGLFGRRNTV